jgi:hypothetical protein
MTDTTKREYINVSLFRLVLIMGDVHFFLKFITLYLVRIRERYAMNHMNDQTDL